MTDVRHTAGQQGEDLAAQHFERLGFEVLARNHRTRHGELDLVVYDGETLVFVEVKTRRATTRGGAPWDALHAGKQRKVRAMAASFLHEVRDRPSARAMRFDAIGVVVDPRGRLV